MYSFWKNTQRLCIIDYKYYLSTIKTNALYSQNA